MPPVRAGVAGLKGRMAAPTGTAGGTIDGGQDGRTEILVKEGCTVYRYFKLTLLGAALVFPIAARAQDRDDHRDRQQEARRYEDRAHHDSHEWNDREDRAYRRYLEEHHKKYHDFAKAKKREQQDYWNWRHSHPEDDRR